MKQENEEMAPEKPCERHEQMVVAVTKMEAKVEAMEQTNATLVTAIESVKTSIIAIEKNLIWWGGLFGTGGAVLVAIISNLDKLKGLFS